MKRLILLCIASSIALVLGASASAAPPPQTWTAGTAVPEPAGVEGACTATIGDSIYVAFGFSAGDSNRLRIYNIADGTWTVGPSAPTAGRSEFYKGVAHGGTLYCAFGRSTTETWSFTPATGTWTSQAPTPDLRAGTAADSWGNSIYYFGGRHALFGPCNGPPVTSADPDGTIVRYDIDTNSWSPAGNLAVPVTDATATTVGGLVYIFGGCDSTGNAVSTVQIYDPRTQTTTLGTPMPSPRSDASSAAAGPHTIRVVGGEAASTNPPNNHLIYDVNTGTFSTGPSLPTHCPAGVGRGEFDLESHGDRLFAIAGSCPGFGASINNLDILKLS